VVIVGLKAFKTLMAEEGVKRGLIRGFKMGELKLGPSISMLKAGRRGWPGAAGFNGDVARLGGAGREKKGLPFGAHMSVTGKSRGTTAECSNLKRRGLSMSTPRLLGPTGLSGEKVACKARQASLG
jgi:hypothetical protein